MNKKCNAFFQTYGEHLVRLVLGLIFLIGGYGKLFAQPGIEGFSGWLGSLGFPIPLVLAVLVGVVEFVGGIFLLIGLWTRQSAAALAIVMLVANLAVHISQSWNELRYPLLLFVVLLYYTGFAPEKTLLSGMSGKPAKKGKKK